MNAIDFVIRTRTGAVERGSVGGEEQGFLLDASGGNDISLNIGQMDLRGYDRAANDLLITLADGRVIVLENYFTGDGAGGANSRLFLSAGGELNQVSFVEADGGALFAQYGPTETWGKWSPTDELIFVDDPQVVPQVAGAYDGEEEQVSMLGTALLGLGGAGAGGLGALLGLPLLIGRGGSGDDGGDGTPPASETPADWTAPTVDDPDASNSVSGNDDPTLTITGTANPGSTVSVTIGGETVTGTAGDDGTWSLTFTGDDFPPDGTYTDIPVTVTDPNGTVTVLDGPSFVIDTTPPEIEVTAGTVSVGEIVNAEEHESGVTVSGTGEAGATLTIAVGTASQTTTIAEDGSWSFTFDETVFAEGEYTTEITLTATDALGNATVVTESVQVDTVNMVSLSNTPLTGDDLISASEHAAGVTFTGTSQAGTAIAVVIGGVTHTATAGGDGSWSVTFSSTDLAEGTYEATATITSTDLAGNVATLTHTFNVDTEATVTIDTTTIAGDGVVNAAEFSSNVTVGGTGEAGSTITVMSGGVSLGTTTVGADGAWSLEFSPSLIDGGPGDADLGYTGTLTVTATDLAGNTSTASGDVKVDTNVSAFAGFDHADGVLNAGDRAAGVTLTGGSEAGAAISVVVGGQTLTTTAGGDGSWSVAVPTALIPEGTTTLSATITATDIAGNSTTFDAQIAVDTDIAVDVNTNAVEGDGVVNAAERADGVLLTGTTDATDGTVTVTVNGNDYMADVQANGAWSVTLPANEIPEGTTSLPVTATAVDAAGNSTQASGTIAIDTETNVAVMTATVEGDGVVNQVEHSDGVTLTGTAEPGAAVMVSLGAVTRAATVAADGSWSVNYAAAEIPTGERSLTVHAVATDAAGNTETASSTLDVDTLVRNFGITSTPGGADGVMNANEVAAGLSLTGTTEPGGAVQITLNGNTVTASVDASGNWTATFSAAQLPTGEQTVLLTAVSTDLAGNVETINRNVLIDTDAGTLTISPNPVETDDVVNAAEAADGVTLTGTSEAGQMVDVTLNGVTRTVQTDANGIWVANYAPNEVAPGTYTADITATITDSAGNVLTRTDSVEVDTVVDNFAASTDPVEGDNVINAVEASNGFTLTGTTEPGGRVGVIFEGVAREAVVDTNGNWSVSFDASEIPSGEMRSTATIQTVDAAGNPAETTVDFRIDTLVNTLTQTGTVAGDDVVNYAEMQAGVDLNGTVEPGSTVVVKVGGVDHVATVDAGGNWSVTIPGTSFTVTSGQEPVLISATDAAGNLRGENVFIDVDTIAPDTPSWIGYGRDGSGVDLIRTEISDDTVFLGKLDDPSGTPGVSAVAVESSTDIPAIDQTYITLDPSVPDGTHLVLATTDTAGNTSGAYLVTDTPATNDVAMSDDIASALGGFNIDVIDLHFAEDSELTLTEAQITALSETTDTVSVLGGADDTVTITGATAQGNNGAGFNVFSLGDATLLIDEDITTSTGVV